MAENKQAKPQFPCTGCDKNFYNEDLAPYMIDAEGKKVRACRKCIGEWNAGGFFIEPLPFWLRKQQEKEDDAM